MTAQNKDKTPIISFNAKHLDSSCGSGFEVNHEIEPNEFYKKELERFLYKVFIDEQRCKEIDSSLFERSSFFKIVIEIYTDTTFLNYSIYEYKNRWRELYIHMLSFCTNDNSFYRLCDSLLALNIDDGLIAVWNKDANKLNNIKQFEEFNNKDYYQLCQLIAIYHNSNMLKEKKRVIKQLKKIDKDKRSCNFLNLLSRDTKIDYFEFMEIVFGGM